VATLVTGSTLLRLADRWFRAWGSLCLAALAFTAALLAVGADAWRAAFILGHLCALLALLPLGLVLVGATFAQHYRARGDLVDAARATVSHDPLVTGLVLLCFLTVAISLSQFEGNQPVRAAANVASVAMIAVLVVRYLRGSSRGTRS
jgi:hypothetical protein